MALYVHQGFDLYKTKTPKLPLLTTTDISSYQCHHPYIYNKDG